MSAVAPSPAPQPKPATFRLPRFLTHTIGLKIVTALTGVVLTLFVLGHMLGNLQAFQGSEAINEYAKLLRKEPALLWAVRVGLLIAVGLHIGAYLMLARRNQAALGVAYREKKYVASTFASRSMRLSGPLLGVFIIFHILHFTTGTVHPDFHEGDVHANLVNGLRIAPVAIIYVLAMLTLGFHLWHGIWSLFQTLGVCQPRWLAFGRKLATGLTILVVAGFAAVPLAVLAGIIK